MTKYYGRVCIFKIQCIKYKIQTSEAWFQFRNKFMINIEEKKKLNNDDNKRDQVEVKKKLNYSKEEQVLSSKKSESKDK